MQDTNTVPNVDDKAKKQPGTSNNDRITRKVDIRSVAFFALLEINVYMNRTSIGHAKLMKMQDDLNMSSNEMHWAISIFFLTYLIFEIPSIILMHFVGATVYLSVSMITWGGITVGMAFVTNARELMAVRALLGMVQSGYFPGIIIYVSWWYCKKQRTMRIVILFAAAIFSSALGSILAYCFTFMEDIGGLKDWQWMFLIESLPIIPLGIITCLFLDKLPNAIHRLDPLDQQILTNRLQQDAGVTHTDPTMNNRQSWKKMFRIFSDWRIYLFALISICNHAVTKYLTTYLPVLVLDMGYYPKEAHLMTIPPYIIACICCLLVGYSSSRQDEHVCHHIACLVVSLLGFILFVTMIDRGRVMMYISSCIACCGMLSAYPLLLAWLTNKVDDYAQRAMAIGFVMGLGQIGGIVLPLVYDDETRGNQRGHFVCIGLVCASFLVTIILHLCMMLADRSRNSVSPEDRA